MFPSFSAMSVITGGIYGCLGARYCEAHICRSVRPYRALKMSKHHRRQRHCSCIWCAQCSHMGCLRRSARAQWSIDELWTYKICDQRKHVVQLTIHAHKTSIWLWSAPYLPRFFVFCFVFSFAFRSYSFLVTSHSDPRGHIRRIDSMISFRVAPSVQSRHSSSVCSRITSVFHCDHN